MAMATPMPADELERLQALESLHLADVPADPVYQGIVQTAAELLDVPIMVITLSPTAAAADRWDDSALYRVADELQSELMKVDDVGLTFIVGGRPQEIRVAPDPGRLALYGVPLGRVIDAVRNANRAFPGGDLRGRDGTSSTAIGQTLDDPTEIGLLTVRAADGRSVYIRDIAEVTLGAREDQARVWRFTREGEQQRMAPAVSLAIAKRDGANAVVVSQAIEALLPELPISLGPVRDFFERSRVDAAAPELRVPALRDQSGALQHSQVFGDGGRADLEWFGQFADRAFARQEARENGSAGRAAASVAAPAWASTSTRPASACSALRASRERCMATRCGTATPRRFPASSTTSSACRVSSSRVTSPPPATT